jgi:hypothetical protein
MTVVLQVLLFVTGGRAWADAGEQARWRFGKWLLLRWSVGGGEVAFTVS